MELTGSTIGNSIKNLDLAEVCFERRKSDRNVVVFDKLCSLLNLTDCSDEHRNKLKSLSRLFCLTFNKKLDDVSRNRQKFRKCNEEWLQKEITLPEELIVSPALADTEADQPEPSRPRGRPRKPFEDASLKTKKRRVLELAASRTSDELQFAAGIAAGSQSQGQASSLTVLQALALYLDLDLSESKYKVLRSVANSLNKDMFPSLYALNQCKNALLPSLTVSDVSAEVNLQELLKLTASSIIKVANLEEGKFKLVCKWGFDGSSGHSQYKQVFSDASCTDEYLFLVAVVPLKLVDVDTGRDVWVNPRPSSTLYCRPIKFMFKKENADLVRAEELEMNNKISQLQTCEVVSESGRRCHVSCEMLFTMMDGSVGNVLSNTNATSKCIICGANPKEMNTENVLNLPPTVENYRFGLSTLHCWIRFFECLLHIGYRLPIKAWQVRGNENKAVVDNNKKRIQFEFKSKMGLLVDKPKPGYGSTNDGNTARRFFSNPGISSDITGVDKELIVKFSIILRVLASGKTIDVVKFRLLLDETRRLYMSLYPWYYMPSSVHKVLIHSCDIISSFSLPIGQLSEDALEARHKEVRRNRLSHTRKCSRVSSNKDLMRVLLLSSEPMISSKRKITTKKSVRLDIEVLKYLEPTKIPSGSYEVDLNLDLELGSDEDSSDSE